MLNLTHEPVVAEYLRDVAQAIEDAEAAGPGGDGVVASY